MPDRIPGPLNDPDRSEPQDFRRFRDFASRPVLTGMRARSPISPAPRRTPPAERGGATLFQYVRTSCERLMERVGVDVGRVDGRDRVRRAIQLLESAAGEEAGIADLEDHVVVVVRPVFDPRA